jgi:hypothetical protein
MALWQRACQRLSRPDGRSPALGGTGAPQGPEGPEERRGGATGEAYAEERAGSFARRTAAV